jgi:RNA polymerase sigma-70 factor (ECF subfamily)
VAPAPKLAIYAGRKFHRTPARRGAGSGAFESTHWTVVLEAAQQDSAAGDAALASLCTMYWYPIYAFIRRSGRSPRTLKISRKVSSSAVGKELVEFRDPRRGPFSVIAAESGETFSNQRP